MVYLLKFLKSLYEANMSVSGKDNQCFQQVGNNNIIKHYLLVDKRDKNELIKEYLKDPNSWSQTENEIHEKVFYHKSFPEFTVTISNKFQRFHEPWAIENFPDRMNTCKNTVYIKYGLTILFTTYVIYCDGSRYITGLPMQWIRPKHDNTALYCSYYFAENSIEHIIHLFVSSHSKSLCAGRPEFPYPDRLPTFKSKEDAEKALTKDFNENKKYKYFARTQKEGIG